MAESIVRPEVLKQSSDFPKLYGNVSLSFNNSIFENELLLVGGIDFDDNTTNGVFSFNTMDGSCKFLTDLPEKMEDCCSVMTQIGNEDFLYVYGVNIDKLENNVRILNLSSNIWNEIENSNIDSISEVYLPKCDMCAINEELKFLFFGLCHDRDGIYAVFHTFDVKQKKWENQNDKKNQLHLGEAENMSFSAGCFLGRRVFCMKGPDPKTGDDDLINDSAETKVVNLEMKVSDVIERKWETFEACGQFPKTVAGNPLGYKDRYIIYWTGFLLDPEKMNENDLYILDTESRKWTKYPVKSTDLPLQRNGRAVLIAGDYLYVFGGSISDQKIQPHLEKPRNDIFRINLEKVIPDEKGKKDEEERTGYLIETVGKEESDSVMKDLTTKIVVGGENVIFVNSIFLIQ